MKLNSMKDLYKEQLQDLYDAEHQILKALPEMIECASAKELKNAFQEHHRQTQHQVKRLEQIFNEMGEKPQGEKCKAMEGIIKEAEHIIKEKGEPEVLDAALIASVQRVEHYEIAGYGTAKTYARMLGHNQAAHLLEETLQEEKKTDHMLTELAESKINARAAV